MQDTIFTKIDLHPYERAGTASIFMFCEAPSSWCRVTARKRRTKADWAEEVASLLEGRYADCEKIILVCDNLNTHTPGAFYEATCAGAGSSEASSATRRSTGAG